MVPGELNRRRAFQTASASGTSVAHRTISTARGRKTRPREHKGRQAPLIQFTVGRGEFKFKFEADKNATFNVRQFFHLTLMFFSSSFPPTFTYSLNDVTLFRRRCQTVCRLRRTSTKTPSHEYGILLSRAIASSEHIGPCKIYSRPNTESVVIHEKNQDAKIIIFRFSLCLIYPSTSAPL